MKKSNKILIGALIPIVLIFIYFYPRFLIDWLGKSNPWTSYLYQYTFGLIFFSLGILLILRTKACQLGRGRDSLWFKILIAGFFFFASFHGFWIFMSLAWPVKG
ncbi:MAG: hypothetical protein H6625_04590 [Bdellovibrionaceae bacterium]|nr:hypothetical protein [Pseudobdellovibrionaceae bacterium]